MKKILGWVWFGLLVGSFGLSFALYAICGLFDLHGPLETLTVVLLLGVFIPGLFLTISVTSAAQKADETQETGWRWCYQAFLAFWINLAMVIGVILMIAGLPVLLPFGYLNGWIKDFLKKSPPPEKIPAVSVSVPTPISRPVLAATTPQRVAASPSRRPVQQDLPIGDGLPLQAFSKPAIRYGPPPEGLVILDGLKNEYRTDSPTPPPGNPQTNDDENRYPSPPGMEPVPKGEPLGEEFTLACGSGGCQAFKPKKAAAPPSRIKPREGDFLSTREDGSLRAARWVRFTGPKGITLDVVARPFNVEYPCHHCLEPLGYAQAPGGYDRRCPVCGRFVLEELHKVHPLLLDSWQQFKLLVEDLSYHLHCGDETSRQYPWRVSGSNDPTGLRGTEKKFYRKLLAQRRLLGDACRYLLERPWDRLTGRYDANSVALAFLEDYGLDDGGLAEYLHMRAGARRDLVRMLGTHAGAARITAFQLRLLSVSRGYIRDSPFKAYRPLRERLRGLRRGGGQDMTP